MVMYPYTSEGLLDRAVDDHKNQLSLEVIPLRTLALNTIYRKGLLEVPPLDTSGKLDPSIISTSEARA